MADVRSIIYQHSQATTTGIASAATALAANPSARGAWSIQNLGQNALFVKLGSGASSTDFNWVLKGATANDDGTGGVISQEMGTVYTGIITIAGTSPRYVATEI